MKKFLWVVAGALLLGVGSRTPARAQNPLGDTELSHGWDIRLGFFIPEREAARSAEGDVWLTAGIERDVFQMDRWRGTFSVDYYGSGPVYNVPFTLNVRGDTQRVRFGAGAGIGLSHDLQRGQNGFTYNLLVGYILKQGANPVTADIRYMGLSTGNGALNGWAFTLGFHF